MHYLPIKITDCNIYIYIYIYNSVTEALKNQSKFHWREIDCKYECIFFQFSSTIAGERWTVEFLTCSYIRTISTPTVPTISINCKRIFSRDEIWLRKWQWIFKRTGTSFIFGSFCHARQPSASTQQGKWFCHVDYAQKVRNKS